MAFDFCGFFARADAPEASFMVRAAKLRWPRSRVRVITKPFRGIGVTSPRFDYWDYAFNPGEEIALEESNPVERDVCEWSRQYPATTFVFVCAECWGGACQYEGFVCSQGRITGREKGKGALRRLMEHLDVQLGANEYFEPFERGFFDSPISSFTHWLQFWNRW